jgi:carbon-monoxide dehydrogenase large subunit
MAEGGTIAAPAAVASAVADALAGGGVDPAAIDFYPLTPARIFALLDAMNPGIKIAHPSV